MRNFDKVRKRNFYDKKCVQLGFFILMTILFLINASHLLAAEPYYKGKTLILLNNFPPGGSSDVWTRLLARHVSRFIPGGPTVIVQNMPGGNGLIGYQWISKVAKPDGLVIGCLGGSLVAGEAMGENPPGTQSFAEAAVIAGLGDFDVWFGRKAIFPQGYKSLLSPTKRPFVIANLKRDDSYVRDQAVMSFLGLKRGQGADYIQVYGYPGGNDAYLAMGRGEIDIYVTRVSGFRATPLREIKAGNWVSLFQSGVYEDTGKFVRDPGIKDIPTVTEVAQELTGKYPAGPYFEFFKWRNQQQTVTRLVVVSPRTPKELYSIITEAWERMMKDSQYRSDQEKVFGSKEENMIIGEKARRQIQTILNKPAVVDKVYEELISK